MFGIVNKDKAEVVAKSLFDDKVSQLSLAHAEITKLQAKVESLLDLKEELHEQLHRQEAKHNAEIEQFKVQIKRTENSINVRVNDALASVGVSQFAIETIYNSVVDDSPEQLVRKYNSLPVESRHEFYIKHKDVIDRATRTDIRSVKP